MAIEINCAAATPLDAQGRVDVARLHAHLQWLDERGCAGFGVFGTTGEGQSFPMRERIRALDDLVHRGAPPERLTVGTGCAALAETIELSRHAASLGCRACLVVPPFLFNEPGDEGLRAAFDPLLEMLASTSTGAILYHIPKLTGVTISPALLATLARDHPETVLGVKDSGGDWEFSLALLEAAPDLDVYLGNEPDLLRPELVRIKGTISGLANVVPDLMVALAAGRPNAGEHVVEVVEALCRHPVVPALKALVARVHDDARWAIPQLPLRRLDDDALARLSSEVSRWL